MLRVPIVMIMMMAMMVIDGTVSNYFDTGDDSNGRGKGFNSLCAANFNRETLELTK